jgi:hypothetical protein
MNSSIENLDSLPMTEKAKAMGVAWKHLSAHEKQVFEKQAKEAQKEYNAVMESYSQDAGLIAMKDKVTKLQKLMFQKPKKVVKKAKKVKKVVKKTKKIVKKSKGKKKLQGKKKV